MHPQNPSSIVEFGSGRGQLTYWITKSVPQDNLQAYDFLLVDRASHRHKFDNRLKDQENITIQRIRADIQDLVLQKMSKAQPGTDSKVYGNHDTSLLVPSK